MQLELTEQKANNLLGALDVALRQLGSRGFEASAEYNLTLNLIVEIKGLFKNDEA